MRIATAMAEGPGLGIKSAAQGLGTIGQKGVEGAGAALESIGAAVKRLFGGDK